MLVMPTGTGAQALNTLCGQANTKKTCFVNVLSWWKVRDPCYCAHGLPKNAQLA